MDIGTRDYDWGSAIDAAIFTVIAQRLMTPNHRLPAFKMGLIDKQGNIKREPKTKQELRALTYIDRIALLMKRSMGGRIASIYNMYRKQRTNPDFIRSAARAVQYRFLVYYDMKIGFYEFPGGTAFPDTHTSSSYSSNTYKP